MKGKVIFVAWSLLLLLLVAVDPAAAAEGEPVYLPGWVAWTMVAISLGAPTALYFYLRKRGRL